MFPFAEPPAPGQVIEVAPGILWARIPLPFRLNHINVYLIDDGDGWADPGHRHRQRRNARGLEHARQRAAGGAAPDPPDRHALPPRPHRPRRLAVRALLAAAADQPDVVSRLPQHLAQSRRARRQALSRFLPAPRSRCGDDAARCHAGARLPQDGVGPAADVHAPRRRRHAQDRRSQLRRADGQRPRPGAGDALLRGGQHLPRRRPGVGQDHAQHQRVGCRSGRRSARPLHSVAAAPSSSKSPPMRWCCRAISCRSTACIRAATS